MYTLDNAHELNQLYPDSFYIPSFKEIREIEVGKVVVKLIFRELDMNNKVNVERMWVLVTGKIILNNKIYFEGRLDNEPYDIKTINYNDKVEFSNENIIGIEFI